MGERSASDREGVGSTPTSGPQLANPGYAAFQLARALTTAQQHEDPATRERARHRADTWFNVFTQMLQGQLQVGSRTPLDKVPSWVTLEVVTGGFATGTLLAGGELLEHEREIAAKHSLTIDANDRVALNGYFLTDEGFSELRKRLHQGTYDISVPEEAALLVVTWLTDNDHCDEARELLSQLAPFFGRLRFYPQPTERPQRFGSKVFIQNVNATIESLHKVRPNPSIAAQKEAIEVWTPLYDELVGLFLETVEGPPPNLAVGPDGKAEIRNNGKFPVEGGWPCRLFRHDWNERAMDFLRRFELKRKEYTLSSKPRHRKSSLAQLVPYLSKCVQIRLRCPDVTLARSDCTSLVLSPNAVCPVRLSVALFATSKHVRPKLQCFIRWRPSSSLAFKSIQAKRASRTSARLQVSISESETAYCGLPAGRELPESIRRKIERCLSESIEVLIERGLIPSGDVLAKVLPQLTSGLRAAGISDPQLRQLYAATYRAFRRRRSLLLLDLQSQVKIEELPWVAAIEQFRSDSLSTHQLARQTLDEVVSLTLVSFPHAIIPNKLLQELRALAKGAGLDIPLVDELAADIFMGDFSGKFVQAAKQAAGLMNGTLYQIYYGIDYVEVLKLPDSKKIPTRSWFSRPTPTQENFAKLCCSRAGVTQSGWDPATNGMIIEQQQIVTTQNLASLFVGLELAESLRPYLVDMARRSFVWICRRQQVNTANWHARLITVTNTAYAWRQMVFYLSFVDNAGVAEFIAWAESHLASQQPEFRARFQPAFKGLIVASRGEIPAQFDGNSAEGRQFLGWSKSRHWLLG